MKPTSLLHIISTSITVTTIIIRSVEHIYIFFFNFACEAIGTAATPGLLCQHRVIVKMIVEKQMEYRLAGETEVLGEKTCLSATFVHQKNPT
jgi:hypothetical protein